VVADQAMRRLLRRVTKERPIRSRRFR